MRMANGVEGAGYWLPSEFLTDNDFLIDKENFNNSEPDADFCFPTEFPYDFQTQKFCAMSISPQSTLGSNNRSQYYAVGDLLYLAKPKVNPYPPPRNLAQFHNQAEIPTPALYLNKSFENIGPRAARGGVGHAAWGPHQGRTARDGGGAAAEAKKACAGTGVFLPRRYDTINTHSSAPHRRPGTMCSASPFQGRETAQIHTKPLMYRFVESRPPQPKIGGGFASDHNSALAQRRALVLLQQRRSFAAPVAEGSQMIDRDHPCLPPDWTY